MNEIKFLLDENVHSNLRDAIHAFEPDLPDSIDPGDFEDSIQWMPL